MANDATPVISRVLPDGTLIEALYDADAGTTALAIREPNGAPQIFPQYGTSNGEKLVPYSPHNNLLASGCVLLPSDLGEVRDKRDLADDVRRFLHRYVDLSPTFETIAVYYVLLTWMYDAFNELPYLRLRGEFGTGKTRALLAIGSVCYKPFFASGASTVSPIFHVLDAFGSTLMLDEADFRFSDATAELTKILNNGTIRGLPVLRTMTNRHRELNPTAFRVFGPKVVAMRESFADPALESRFLTEDTGGRPLRNDIPIHLPDSLAVEARELRNKLLSWRLLARGTVGIDPGRLLAGVSPRANQTALSLLSVVDDPARREEIAVHLLGEVNARELDRRNSDEARAVQALIRAFKAVTTPFATVADVTRRFNESLDPWEQPLSNRAVGAIVRKLGVTTSKSRGIYVIAQSEWARIDALAQQYNAVGDAIGNVMSASTC